MDNDTAVLAGYLSSSIPGAKMQDQAFRCTAAYCQRWNRAVERNGAMDRPHQRRAGNNCFALLLVT